MPLSDKSFCRLQCVDEFLDLPESKWEAVYVHAVHDPEKTIHQVTVDEKGRHTKHSG